MARVAGVVIAYYPDIDRLLSNIRTFIDNVEQLFIVFNSPVSEEIRIMYRENSKVQLVINKENRGIAAVLNQIAEKALKLEYEWLLTMDQDSSFQSNKFFEIFSKTDNLQVAIYSPTPDLSLESESENPDLSEEVLQVITSGNLLNLGIWKSLGGFEEKLFIDEVDNDYCLKAVSNGYKIVRFKNIPLIHELGHKRDVIFLFKKHTIIVHPPIRAYYVFRNNFYIFSRYKKIFPEFVSARKIILLKSFVKILLYSTERFQNCRYIFLGIRDYMHNSFGQCSYK